jgi:glycerol-3-phosphate O-acyltransferase
MTIPVWLFVVLAVLAAIAVLDRLLLPSVRWFFRGRVNRVVDELNTRLDLKIQPLKLTKRDVLIDRLTFDSQVMEAVDQRMREEDLPRDVVMDDVKRFAREIVPAFNAYLYFRIGTWLARRLSTLLYRVRVGVKDGDSGASLSDVDPNATVVFVMNHRSNMDYVLVAFLAAERAALSYAVGEWARIWPLHQLIRAMGAYFVRRGSGNTLYRRVLERYIRMATEAGVTQAVFPEGGLSRDGRLRVPRLGILGYMVKGFDPQDGPDIVFVPVGLNYDRVLEDRTLLRSLDPEAPRRTKRFILATTTRFVWRNFRQMLQGRWVTFGYACVNFGTPVSLRAWCNARGFDPRRAGAEALFPAVETLGADLMANIGAVVPVLPVPLLAATLRRAGTRRFSELELKTAAQALKIELEAAGAHLYVPRHRQDYALTVALSMLRLRGLVVQDADGLYAAAPEQASVLDYYAASITHLLPETALAQASSR